MNNLIEFFRLSFSNQINQCLDLIIRQNFCFLSLTYDKQLQANQHLRFNKKGFTNVFCMFIRVHVKAKWKIGKHNWVKWRLQSLIIKSFNLLKLKLKYFGKECNLIVTYSKWDNIFFLILIISSLNAIEFRKSFNTFELILQYGNEFSSFSPFPFVWIFWPISDYSLLWKWLKKKMKGKSSFPW